MWLPFGDNPLFRNFWKPKEAQQELKQAGMLDANLTIQWTPSSPDKHHCHHEKTFIFNPGKKDSIVITGGVIPGVSWDGPQGHANGSHSNHDVCVELQGPSAWDVAAAFHSRFIACPKDAPYFCSSSRKPHHLDLPPFPTHDNALGSATCQVQRSLRPNLVSAIGPTGFDPRGGEGSILQQWLQAIDGAKTLIYIEQQHFVHVALMEALLRALKRGVQIIYLRPGKLHPNVVLQDPVQKHEVVQAAFLGKCRPPYEQACTKLCPQFDAFDNWSFCSLVFPGHIRRRTVHVHSKMMIVDDKITLCGSANLVDISMNVADELHTEIQVTTWCPKLALSMRAALMEEHTGICTKSMSMKESFAAWVQFAKKNAKHLQAHGDPLKGYEHATAFAMHTGNWGTYIMPTVIHMHNVAK